MQLFFFLLSCLDAGRGSNGESDTGGKAQVPGKQLDGMELQVNLEGTWEAADAAPHDRPHQKPPSRAR
jgi:hypothetical protein